MNGLELKKKKKQNEKPSHDKRQLRAVRSSVPPNRVGRGLGRRSGYAVPREEIPGEKICLVHSKPKREPLSPWVNPSSSKPDLQMQALM